MSPTDPNPPQRGPRAGDSISIQHCGEFHGQHLQQRPDSTRGVSIQPPAIHTVIPAGPCYSSPSRLMLWSRRIPSASLLPSSPHPHTSHLQSLSLSVSPALEPASGSVVPSLFLPQPLRSPDLSSSIPLSSLSLSQPPLFLLFFPALLPAGFKPQHRVVSPTNPYSNLLAPSPTP